MSSRTPTKPGPTIDELAARRAEILELAARNHARNVRVFGSVARGTADDRSDIDFLVDFEPRATLLDLSGLILDLEAALGRRVSVVSASGSSPVMDRIKLEAAPL